MSNLQKQDLQMSCREIIDIDSEQAEYVAIARDKNGRAVAAVMGDNPEDVKDTLLRKSLLKRI